MDAIALVLPVAFAALLGGMSAVERWLNQSVGELKLPEQAETAATSPASASAPEPPGTDLPPTRQPTICSQQGMTTVVELHSEHDRPRAKTLDGRR